MAACGKQDTVIDGDVLPEAEEVIEQKVEEALQGENEGIYNGFSLEPHDVFFETLQGRISQGRYFADPIDNAPLIVLIHRVAANQDDWQVAAAWLQNRWISLKKAAPRYGV